MCVIKNEDTFRFLFELPGISVALVSPQGKILEANHTACGYWGYSADEIKGLTIQDLTHPEDLEESLPFYAANACSTNHSFSYKKRYIRKDGTTVWGQVSAIWMAGKPGSPPCGLALVQDITDNQRAHELVAFERAFFQSVVDSLVEPLKIMDLNHQILAMNRAAHQLLPKNTCNTGALFCDHMSQKYHLPCLANTGSCNLEKIRDTGQPIRTLHRHQTTTGEDSVFEITAAPLIDETGLLRGIIETSRNITDLLTAEAKIQENVKRLEYVTHYDLLTNLPNQTLLIDRLNQTLARAQRFADRFAVLALDLNRFRHINDSLGNHAGDALLSEVAQRLSKRVRESDTLARLRGNEFVVVMEQFRNINHLVEVAQRLLHDISREMLLEGLPVYITASIGISLFPEDASTVDELLRCANAAMQRARDEGGNNYQFYTPGMTKQSRQRLELESQFRQAIAEEQLTLYYQPQIDLISGRCIGTESLVRWIHPQRGIVSPGTFIPMAEETGLIEPMGLWVLKIACLWNKALHRKGSNPVPVSVNISARQLYCKDFPATVQRILEETGLEPDYLELEITESMLMKDLQTAIAVMSDLNRLGISIAMDDFGTGYSSLSYLHRFPITKLKIDQSFVKDLVTDANARTIARSIVALAGSLNLRVLAEGVENKAQATILQEMGCNEIQGFLFSKPLPALEAEQFLSNKQRDGVPLRA